MRVTTCRGCGVMAVCAGADPKCVSCAGDGSPEETPATVVRELRSAAVRGVRADVSGRLFGVHLPTVIAILSGRRRGRVR